MEKKICSDAVLDALKNVFAALTEIDPEDSFCVSYIDHRLTVKYTISFKEDGEEK